MVILQRRQRAQALDASFEAAFDDLFERARRLAERILSDRAAAEDVAAEALARAYSRWDSLATEPWRDGWVLRVATNLAIDVTRKRQPRLEPPTLQPVDDAAALRVALVAALRTLPDRQREAIVLRYLAGMSESEVAAALKVAPGTVKTHLHRGVSSLRDSLGVDLEEVSPS